MKRLGWMFLAALLAVSPVAAEGSWYADVFAGFGETDDTSFGVLGTSTIATTFDSNFAYGVTFGYDFDNAWRVEGELTRREADVDTHDLDGGGAIAGSFGEGNSTAIFANIFYDFENDSRVTPYVGGGIGTVQVDYANFGVPGLAALDDDDDVFGFQLAAGIAVDINDTVAFRTDLRLLEPGDAELTSSAATGSTTSDVSYSSLDVTVGLRFNF